MSSSIIDTTALNCLKAYYCAIFPQGRGHTYLWEGAAKSGINFDMSQKRRARKRITYHQINQNH